MKGGNRTAATQKPESKLWLELTGMTKAEIQLKAAEEMRFVLINSTFNNALAKDAINKVNSKEAMHGGNAATSFSERAKREMQYFQDYVTGGFYVRSNLKRKLKKISDESKEE